MLFAISPGKSRWKPMRPTHDSHSFYWSFVNPRRGINRPCYRKQLHASPRETEATLYSLAPRCTRPPTKSIGLGLFTLKAAMYRFPTLNIQKTCVTRCMFLTCALPR